MSGSKEMGSAESHGKRIDPGPVGSLSGPEAASLAGRAIALAMARGGRIEKARFDAIFARPELRGLAAKAGLVAEGYFKRALQGLWLCEKMRAAGLLDSDGTGFYKPTELGASLALEWSSEAAEDERANSRRAGSSGEIVPEPRGVSI